MTDEQLFLLDTSAMLAFRSDEAGADTVERLLRQSEKTRHPLLASFMTRMELLYIIWRHDGEYEARRAVGMVDTFNIQWISCEPEILECAARLKSRGNLSIAGCWIAATAIIRRAVLLHKDPEFRQIPELREQFLSE
ncbi:MAG: PIN domain-containing protein [Acidobacteria bacterium]|nr:PIN domain-containing protein [Acidobacteriota bacterium]